MNRLIQRLVAAFHRQQQSTVDDGLKTQKQLLKTLETIPHWEKKIETYNRFSYSPGHGRWAANPGAEPIADSDKLVRTSDELKVNYGCGGNIIPGWLNVDLFESSKQGYQKVDLLDKHPFPDNSVKFGFSEDVLEHLTQAESIFFLGEIFRTLMPGGVIRLSFPGLEGVLEKHYAPSSETRIRQGEFEAYSFWDHVHFYSKAELSLVASHIGFQNITFVDYGASEHASLCKLDTRSHQIGLNTYVELSKQA